MQSLTKRCPGGRDGLDVHPAFGADAERLRAAAQFVDTKFLPKLKIEVAVASDIVDRTIEAISAAARTGQIGDGKIFVSSLEQAVRIRTGERDVDAL